MLMSSAALWLVLNVCSGIVPDNTWDGSKLFEKQEAAQQYIADNPAPEGCVWGIYQANLNLVENTGTEENAQ